MESLLPVMPDAAFPPAGDPAIGRVLELATTLHDARWAMLELTVSDLQETFRYSVGTPERDATTLVLGCRPPYSATLHLPSGPPPEGLAAACAFMLDEVLHVRRLVHQATLLRSAIDASPDAILVFDPPGNILHANTTADRLLSRQTEDGLTVVSRDGGPRPLVDRLCEEVAVVAAGEESDRRNVLPLSDGTALACTVTRLLAADRPVGVLVRLQGMGGAAELALAAFVSEHELSSREADVVTLLHQGLSTAKIADQLAISPHTVRDHLKNLFRKTGTGSRNELLGLLARHSGT